MFCNKLIDSSTWRLEQIKSSFQRRFVRCFPLHCTRCTVQETEQNTWRHFHFLLQVAGHVITCTTEVSNKTKISQNHPQRFDLQSEIIIRADFRSRISASNLPIMWLSWELPSSEFMLLHIHSHTASIMSLPVLFDILDPLTSCQVESSKTELLKVTTEGQMHRLLPNQHFQSTEYKHTSKCIKCKGVAYISATSAPFPKNSASMSIPSSSITVESTSRHTQSADFQMCLMSSIFDLQI